MTEPSFQHPPHLIELQLLRHGDANNQLMSPLTDYLALCGDYPAATINVPLKHQALLTRLRALDYKDSNDTRLDQLDELTSVVSTILTEFPGLSTELSRCEDRIAHVSLATSAAEMAMVPFELGMMPSGTAGAGQRLGLQPHIAVCLTRRSRNVNRPSVNWRQNFRILMIASDAGGDVPVVQHYALLRKLVDPWLDVPEQDDEAASRDLVEKCVVLLRNPTINDIAELLKRESFSHIHILAHGAPQDERGSRFGVALRSTESADGMDVVDGERLGGVLGYRPECPDNSPLVVSLAICQSGRQGGVVVPGSSLAFELHNKGVPIVVGSQFPLTFGGALVMTSELYGGLLAGRDPRYVIWKTRTALFEMAENTVCNSGAGVQFHSPMHDWASMTVYADLPDEIDHIIPAVKRGRYVGRLTPKMDFLDSIARSLHESDIESDASSPKQVSPEWVRSEWQKLLSWTALQAPREGIDRFRDWIENSPGTHDAGSHRAESKGILASAQKRLGLVFLQIAAHGQNLTSTGDGTMASALLTLLSEVKSSTIDGTPIHSQSQLQELLDTIGMGLLRDAKRSYDHVFQIARTESWALVQSLSLSVAMSNWILRKSYETALQLNELDRANPNPSRRTWSLAAIAELLLVGLVNRDLRQAAGKNTFIWQDRDMRKEFVSAVKELTLMADQEPNEVRSALLQLRRFDTDLILLAAAAEKADARSSQTAAPTTTRKSTELEDSSEEELRSSTGSGRYSSEDRIAVKSWTKAKAKAGEKVMETAQDLRTFVRETVDPLFAEFDIEHYR